MTFEWLVNVGALIWMARITEQALARYLMTGERKHRRFVWLCAASFVLLLAGAIFGGE